jgi:hydrogenase nickel incorporation protein HypB
MKISIQKRILEANDRAAAENAAFFARQRILCINMISSPGSGKTSILSRTISELKHEMRIGVIEGDLKTDLDARRIRASGAPAVQIETNGACHLTALQVADALKKLPADALDVIFIENVGNLVCPSAFELGESIKVIVLSTAEGDDKPAKYPGTFARAGAILVNKTDLLSHVDFDMELVASNARQLRPEVEIFALSAKTGDGFTAWYDYLKRLRRCAGPVASSPPAIP